jgi:hypothetical protein
MTDRKNGLPYADSGVGIDLPQLQVDIGREALRRISDVV